MKRTNTILAVVLGAQVALAAVTWSTRGGPSGDAAKPYFDFEAGAVSALTITNKGTAEAPAVPLKLAKKGDGWVVASADDYPAKADKVDEVVKKLAGLKVRAPVANQATSHNALKVGEREFDKQVKLEADGAAYAVVIGGAKGTSVHVRRADAADVYLARGLSAWALSDRASTYVDTQYIKVDDPNRITVRNPAGTVSLVQDDSGAWSVTELPPDAPTDESRINAFVSAARSVQLVEPVGKTAKPEFGLDNGTTVELVSSEGTTTYTIGAKADDNHYVKASDSDFVVKVSKYAVDSLLTQTPDKFIKQPEAPPQGGGMPGMPPGMPGMPGGMRGMPGGMPPGMPAMPPPGR